MAFCTSRPSPKRTISCAGLDDLDDILRGIESNNNNNSNSQQHQRKRHNSVPDGSGNSKLALGNGAHRVTSFHASPFNPPPRRPELLHPSIDASAAGGESAVAGGFAFPLTSSFTSNSFPPEHASEEFKSTDFTSTRGGFHRLHQPRAAVPPPDASPREEFLVRAFGQIHTKNDSEVVDADNAGNGGGGANDPATGNATASGGGRSAMQDVGGGFYSSQLDNGFQSPQVPARFRHFSHQDHGHQDEQRATSRNTQPHPSRPHFFRPDHSNNNGNSSDEDDDDDDNNGDNATSDHHQSDDQQTMVANLGQKDNQQRQKNDFAQPEVPSPDFRTASHLQQQVTPSSISTSASLSRPPAIYPHQAPPAPAPLPTVALTPGSTPSTKWLRDEDERLRDAVARFGGKSWKLIAESLGNGRTDVQCLHRWNKVLKPGLIKGPWTPEEDSVLLGLIARYGVGKIRWCDIALHLPGRIGKQCRERWCNHLDANIRKGQWTAEEDETVFRWQQKLGNKWSEIAKMLPGRTENAVKNRYNSAARRKWLMNQAAKEQQAQQQQQKQQQHNRRKQGQQQQQGETQQQVANVSEQQSAFPFQTQPQASKAAAASQLSITPHGGLYPAAATGNSTRVLSFAPPYSAPPPEGSSVHLLTQASMGSEAPVSTGMSLPSGTTSFAFPGTAMSSSQHENHAQQDPGPSRSSGRRYSSSTTPPGEMMSMNQLFQSAAPPHRPFHLQSTNSLSSLASLLSSPAEVPMETETEASLRQRRPPPYMTFSRHQKDVRRNVDDMEMDNSNSKNGHMDANEHPSQPDSNDEFKQEAHPAQQQEFSTLSSSNQQQQQDAVVIDDQMSKFLDSVALELDEIME